MADREECERIGWVFLDLHYRAVNDQFPEARATTYLDELHLPDNDDAYRALVFPKLEISFRDDEPRDDENPYSIVVRDNNTWHRVERDLFHTILEFSRAEIGIELALDVAKAAVIHSRDAEVDVWGNRIADLLVDQMGEFLAVTWMDKSWDLARNRGSGQDADPRTMPMNELIFQTFRELVGSDREVGVSTTCNLKGIFVIAIKNEEFSDIVEAHYNRAELGFQGKSFGIGVPDEQEGLYQLLGTRVLAVFARFLINHHGATGNRSICQVTIRPSSLRDDHWNALITMGRRPK